MNKEEPTTILGIRSSALLEIALFLIGMLVLDFVLFDAPHTRFFATCLHPFWIIVLLVSAQYGTKEGLVAAIASSAVLLIGNMPEQTINQDMYDYLFLVAKTPLSWLVAAVILGELRQKHIRERAELQQSLADSQEREDRITHSYQFVKDLKEKLELRIAGQLRSSVAAYQAARACATPHRYRGISHGRTEPGKLLHLPAGRQRIERDTHPWLARRGPVHSPIPHP